MPNSKTLLNQKRTIYSNFIYRKNNNDIRRSAAYGDFKSISDGCLEKKKYGSYDGTHPNHSSTQTSKTTIVLSSSPINLDVDYENAKKIKKLSNNSTQTSTLMNFETLKNEKSEEKAIENTYLYVNKKNLNDRSKYLQNASPFLQQLTTEDIDDSNFSTNTPSIISEYTMRDSANSSKNQLNNIDNFFLDKQSCNSSTYSSPRSTKNRKTSSSYMAPTISSENKNAQKVIKKLNKLFTSASIENLKNKKDNLKKAQPTKSTVSCDNYDKTGKNKIYSIKSKASDYLNETFKDIIGNDSEMTVSISSESGIGQSLSKLIDQDWNINMQGLAEVIEFCKIADLEHIFPHMSIINQKLIEFLRSPRAHVCRASCQAAGQLFKLIRDTRRPEFDEIVNLLLFKTADANKFIRQDANVALDFMVTYIPCLHSIRALCSKGPTHKNYLVRTATIRLIVCSVVIYGPTNILNPKSNEHTKQRIFNNLQKFLFDKSVEVRKFAERLLKILSNELHFEFCMKKYFDRETIMKIQNLVIRP